MTYRASTSPRAARSPAAVRDRLARLRMEAPRHVARARTATWALGVLVMLFVPVYCSTWGSGDCGPRATRETSEVTQIGALLAGAVLAVIVMLRARAVIAAVRGMAIARALGREADPADVSDVARAERVHLAKVRAELWDGVVVPSLAWVAILAIAVARVAMVFAGR